MRYTFLLHPAFLLGLLALLLNDHFLKEAYGNWFTGKLSDVAGLLMFPFFLRFLFPITSKQAVWATLLGFVYWKTPYAQPFIDGFNQMTGLHWARVVDYTDFLAFLVLPLAYFFLERSQVASDATEPARRLAFMLVLPVAVFALVATSYDKIDSDPSDGSIVNCCLNDGRLVQVGLGQVYVPSAFTPDSNGVNDYFQVVADSFVLSIDSFIVQSIWFGDTLFFARNMTDFSPENGFDGAVNGRVYAQRLSYAIKVNALGAAAPTWIRGEVCAIPCVDSLVGQQPINFMRCGFATQYTPGQGFDPNAEVGEPLDCL